MNQPLSDVPAVAPEAAHFGKVHPVILCGGVGRRLWPVSRVARPKQFQRLNGGDRSMLQETVLRARDVLELGAPVILCNAEHRYLVDDHLAEIGVEPAAVVCEPQPRNTAPALTVAAMLLAEQDPKGAMMAMPADHVIGDLEAFRAAFDAACPAAAAGELVTFGIRPTRAETGYGYIRQGDDLAKAHGVCGVDRFLEKPDADTAARLIEDERNLWNSGIFLFHLEGLLREVERHEPDVWSACQEALQAARGERGRIMLDATSFGRSPGVSIDVAVMERTERAAVIPVDMAWSDIGSWPALRDVREADERGNIADGNAVLEETENCVVHANGRLVAGIGLKDLVIVDTEDALLISSIDQAGRIDGLVRRLRDRGQPAAEAHKRVDRPWGTYETVEAGARYQVKHIRVKPGERLSLQMHHHRAEHWVVVSGTGRITRDGESELLHENQSVQIPIGASHRLENPGKIPLDLIEVQVGAYLGEDDIVRFNDQYGRS